MNTYYKILNEIASVFDMDQWDEQVNLFTGAIKEQLNTFIYLNRPDDICNPLKILGGDSHTYFYGENNIYIEGKQIRLNRNGFIDPEDRRMFNALDKIHVVIEDLNETIADHCSRLWGKTSTEWGCASMFSHCTELYEVPRFDTSKVNSMQYMFTDCTSLKTVPLLDTSRVTNMNNMFQRCSSLSRESKKEWSSVYNFALNGKR